MLTKTKEGQIQYTFKTGKHSGEIYQASYKVCPGPTCTCTDIDLKLESKNGQLINPAIEVSLYLLNKSISEKTKGDANLKLAKSLVKDFDNNDWKKLRSLFLDKKLYYTENSNLEDLDYVFPIEDIERDGLLISYNEILPFARHIIFEFNGKKIIVDDLYCVFPKCPCKDIHLYFTPFNEEQSIFPFMIESRAETYIIYNFKSKQWHLKQQTKMSVVPEQLMKALKNNYDIQKLFGDRHKTIRRLYLNYRHQNFQPIMPVQITRIGRNDPCPCGSGKKYKKCCMLKIN
jgi:hypothetical protein